MSTDISGINYSVTKSLFLLIDHVVLLEIMEYRRSHEESDLIQISSHQESQLEQIIILENQLRVSFAAYKLDDLLGNFRKRSATLPRGALNKPIAVSNVGCSPALG